MEWLEAVARNPAFAFLSAPEEDLYTLADGEPFRDEVDMRAEVRDFVEFLLAKRGHRARRVLRQEWAGALRDY